MADERGLTASEVVRPVVDASCWAQRIESSMQESKDAALRAGAMLLQAKATLPHGEFGAMVKTLSFGERTAQRLMAIAGHCVLSNPTHVSALPASWATQYELAKLPEPLLIRGIEDGTIHPRMQRKDVSALIPKKAIKPTEKVVDNLVVRRPPELGPPSNGMQFARMAIADLEQIRPDDIERAEALAEILAEVVQAVVDTPVEAFFALGTALGASATRLLSVVQTAVRHTRPPIARSA